jgi:hypothetical protein
LAELLQCVSETIIYPISKSGKKCDK